MKGVVKKVVKSVLFGPLSTIASFVFRFISKLEYSYFNNQWDNQGWKNQTSLK